jgi:hypothetical protein
MEMKEYITPEMEVVELKYNQSLLSASGDGEEAPDTGDSPGW